MQSTHFLQNHLGKQLPTPQHGTKNRHRNWVLLYLPLLASLLTAAWLASALQSQAALPVAPLSHLHSRLANKAAVSQDVIFSGSAKAAVSAWSPTEIAAQVPVDSSSGSVVVTAVHGSSNPISFTLGTSSIPDASGQAASWVTEFAGGVINVDTTWSSDMLIKGDVTVAADTTLTITPGVTIFFTAGSDDQASGDWPDKAEIHIHGTLVAEGTPAAPIYFASNAVNPVVGDWGQIASRRDGSISISHCMVRHADTGIHFISYNEGGGLLTGSVQNCAVSDNRIGVDMYGKPGHPYGGTVTINPVIENNHITNNVEYGVRINGASGYGNVDITVQVQNNVIENSDVGVYLKGGSSWWEGHVDHYATVQNNVIRNNSSMGIYIRATGSNDISGSDTDVQPVIQHNLLENNDTNIHLLLDPQGTDGTQILSPTIRYNSILSATNGILIVENQPYDTLAATIEHNVFFGFTAVNAYAINNQTSRIITVQDDYWGAAPAAWDAGPQAGADITGTVTIDSYRGSSDLPLLTHMAPAQAEAGTAVQLFGANFGEALAPPVFTVNLPFIIKPDRFDPITINDTVIPQRSVVAVGELFYVTTIGVPANLPASGTFYFSAVPNTPEAAIVDDELVIKLNSTELFTYRYGKPAAGVKWALVELPRSVVEQLAGETATVLFRDVYGDKVAASEVYLIWVP